MIFNRCSSLTRILQQAWRKNFNQPWLWIWRLPMRRWEPPLISSCKGGEADLGTELQLAEGLWRTAKCWEPRCFVYPRALQQWWEWHAGRTASRARKLLRKERAECLRKSAPYAGNAWLAEQPPAAGGSGRDLMDLQCNLVHVCSEGSPNVFQSGSLPGL